MFKKQKLHKFFIFCFEFLPEFFFRFIIWAKSGKSWLCFVSLSLATVLPPVVVL